MKFYVKINWVILMKLSKEQERASLSLEGPSMIIAVPGAGKTTILLKRIENLINKGVDPKRILTITFSKAAANELKNRFVQNAKNTKGLPDFYTIHAFSFMILRRYSKLRGIEYKLLEGSKNINKYRLISDFYFKTHKVYISEEKLESIINKIGYLKNMMLSPQDLVTEIYKFEEIYYQYEDFKKKYKFIDFDDMLELALNILKTEPSIRNEYINKYDFIQVDEGQDTSKLQIEIIKILTKKKRNLYIVADDDQSIYSFRGADPQGLFDLEEFFPDLKTYYMETNFRCSQNIVTCANNFINLNKIRYQKTLRANKNYSSPVEVVKVSDPEDQYKYILNDIKEKNLDYKDVGILYRNNVSAMGLVEYFESLDVPFILNESSKIKFCSHRISSDLIDIISFSEDFSRLDIFERIYFKLKGYVSKFMISQIKSYKGMNVFDSLKAIPNLKSYSIRELENLERDFNTLSRLNMRDKLSFIEGNLEYEKFINFSAKKESLGLQGELLVFNILKKISFKASSFKDYIGRLKYLDSTLKTPDFNGIRLSTVHSAKGKEYKQVYLIDIYQGMFPMITKNEKSPLLLEEERRLFYVGLTRAKDHLNIIFPSRIGKEKTEVSDFLLDLQNSCK